MYLDKKLSSALRELEKKGSLDEDKLNTLKAGFQPRLSLALNNGENAMRSIEEEDSYCMSDLLSPGQNTSKNVGKSIFSARIKKESDDNRRLSGYS